MTATMRAKMVVESVKQYGETQETLTFRAVPKSTAYPPDGSDEDNTFARWTPSASCEIHCMNPALFGKFKVGDKFYVDFTPAD